MALFNYIEVKEYLINKGHKLKTKSDVETILHLYEEYGYESLRYLRGMFAFALYDKNSRKLFIARDRLGEKPLFYYNKDGEFIFASELKTMLSTNSIGINIDNESLYQYFHYDYVIEPRTIIKDIFKLEAGNYLIYDVQDQRIEIKKYWDIQNAEQLNGNVKESIREVFNESIMLTLRADVPVGIALSGGLDSSLIAILANSMYKGKLQAFSVGYEGRPETDERDYAKELAKELDIPFNEIELKNEEVISTFEDLIFYRDEPIADIAGSGYYAISKAAKEKGVPVILQGQGADELFWGYPNVIKAAKLSNIKKLIIENKRMFRKDFLNNITGMRGLYAAKSFFKDYIYVKQNMRKASKEQFILFDLWPGYSEIIKNNNLFNKDFMESLSPGIISDIFSNEHPWENVDIMITKILSRTYLRENGIAQGDRLSMANSVELRLPFVDYKLFETVIGFRKNISDYKSGAKYWIKESYSDIIPKNIQSRRKRGFQPPLELWYQLLVKKYFNLILTGYLAENNIINVDNTITLINTEKSSFNFFIFRIIVFEIWMKNIKSKINL